MNILEGKIETIRVQNNLSLVRIKVGQIAISSIVIDTPETAPYLSEGNSIKVIFKETEVIIGSGSNHKISLQNKFKGYVKTIEKGDLLCRITVETSVGDIVSVITANAVNQLQLTEGSEVTAMIKTNEIMLRHD